VSDATDGCSEAKLNNEGYQKNVVKHLPQQIGPTLTVNSHAHGDGIHQNNQALLWER
jgi:hypothetical protein